MDKREILENVVRICGTDVKKCMKCGKCSGRCPAFDQMDISGIEAYTCPVLDGYTVDHSKDRRTDWTLVGSLQESLTCDNVFASLCEREDFQSIVNP